MKKVYLFLLTICVYVTNVYSQLQVDSIGYVGVGMTEDVFAYEMDSVIHSPFAVCTVGIPEAIANFQSSDRQYTLTAYTERANQQGNGTAIWGISYVHNGNSEGIVGIGMGNSYSSSNYTIGVRGEASGKYCSIGVFGGKFDGQVYNNYAGISAQQTQAVLLSYIQALMPVILMERYELRAPCMHRPFILHQQIQQAEATLKTHLLV